MKFPNWVNGVCEFANRHSPALLTGLGIAGFITAVVLAVKATPAAEDLITMAEDEKEDSLTPIETVKAGWKPYIPAMITIVASTGCVLGAAKIQNDRYAELTTAYAISQAIVKRYQEKTAEIAGEEKAKKIDDEVNHEIACSKPIQDSVSKLPPSSIPGMHPFSDTLSLQSFYASVQMLKSAEAELNRRMFTGQEPYITVSDLYDELNYQGIYPPLKHTALSAEYGWYADKGGIEFDICDGIPLEHSNWNDGTPCYVMSFKKHRRPEYIQ